MNVTEAKSVIANIRNSIWSVYCCKKNYTSDYRIFNYYYWL